MLFVSIWLFWTILITCGIDTLDAECNGKTIITGVLNGTLVLNQDAKYPVNSHCEWLIKGKNFKCILLLLPVYTVFNVQVLKY